MKTSPPVIGLAVLALLPALASAASGPAAQTRPAAPSGKTLDAPALARAIDSAIRKRLEERKVPASPQATDEELLRRVYLDIAGVIPTADQATAYLDSKSPDKYARLVESLLAGSEHARQMADVWKELLIPKTAAAARRDHLPLVHWLNKSFAENKPLDKLAREIVAASGMQDENPATTFYVVHESVDEVADRVSRVMLGVQIQCAQCHDHPFADWKQKEYWAFAGFFTKVGRLFKRVPKVGDRYGVSETSPTRLMLPSAAKKAPLRYLRGQEAKISPEQPYLPALAEWITSADNPWFARAQVNRIWYHFFGRGLVNPVDSMNADNPASHPELLELLSRSFIDSGFNARLLMQAICLSETYRRSCRATDENRTDQTLYSHRAVRVLLPFQLHDSWELVARNGVPKPPADTGDSKAQRAEHGQRNGFAQFFAAEEGALPTDYRAGIPQALRLINTRDHYRLSKIATGLARESKTPADAITRMFLMTLSRRPRPAELERLTTLHASRPKGSPPGEIFGDILWALVNSTEFVTNH